MYLPVTKNYIAVRERECQGVHSYLLAYKRIVALALISDPSDANYFEPTSERASEYITQDGMRARRAYISLFALCGLHIRGTESERGRQARCAPWNL